MGATSGIIFVFENCTSKKRSVDLFQLFIVVFFLSRILCLSTLLRRRAVKKRKSHYSAVIGECLFFRGSCRNSSKILATMEKVLSIKFPFIPDLGIGNNPIFSFL